MKLADVLCILMALVWGANLSLAKDALDQIPPLAFNGVRLPAAAVLLAGLVRLRGMKLLPRREDRLRIFLLGLLGNVVYQLLFLGGLELTRAGNTALLLGSSAIWIALLSRLAGHERVGRPVAFAIALSVSGVAVLFWESAGIRLDPEALVGDFLILCCALCWSLFTVLARPLLQRHPPLLVTTQTLVAGGAVFLLLAVPSIAAVPWRTVSTTALLELGYSTVFAIAVAYTIWFIAVERIGNTRTALYNNLVPFFGLLIAGVFFGEDVTTAQLAGGALIMVAVTLARRGAAAVSR